MRNPLTTKLLLAIVLAAAAPAFAGSTQMIDKNTAAVPAPCNWTGIYVGASAGVTELQSRFTDLNNFGYNGEESEYANFATTTYEVPAFIGGGQVGYNYQWRDLVLGIEADFSGLGGAINHNDLQQADSNGFESTGIDQRAKVDFLGTLRARAGISILENRGLIYVTAGGAYAHGKWDSTSFDGSNFATWRTDDWRYGYTAGMGLEYALNCNWSVRAEGLYTVLSSKNENIASTNNFQGDISRWRFEDDLVTYRIGINYKFNGFFGGR